MLLPNNILYAGDPLVYKPTRFAGNLKGWWSGIDPLANGTLPADSSALSTWKDKSANGNDFLQATMGLQPLFKRSAVNNLAGVLFAGGQYMKAPVIATLPHSFTFLVQSASTDVQVAFFNGYILSSNGYGYVYDATASPDSRGILDGGSGSVKDDGTVTSNFEVITIGWDGTNSHLRVNGIDQDIISPTLAPVLPTTNLYLGVDNPDPSFSDYLTGYICEMIARNSWVTSNVQADEKYIISTYQIT